jgi:peroxiredoxin
MPGFSVVCPSCQSVLTVSKPSLIGKRVACPSCQKPLLIQAPAERAEKDVAAPAAKQKSPSGSVPTAQPSRETTKPDDRPSSKAWWDDAALPPLQDEPQSKKPSAETRTSKQGASSGSIPIGKQPREGAKSGPVPSPKSSWDDAPLLPLVDEAPAKKSEEVKKGQQPKRPASPSKSQFLSEAESSEFNAMLTDTDDEIEPYTPPPLPGRRSRAQDSTQSHPAMPTADDESESLLPEADDRPLTDAPVPRRAKPSAPRKKSVEPAEEETSYSLSSQEIKSVDSREKPRSKKKRRKKGLPASPKQLAIAGLVVVGLAAAYLFSTSSKSPERLPAVRSGTAGNAADSSDVAQEGGSESNPAAAVSPVADNKKEEAAVARPLAPETATASGTPSGGSGNAAGGSGGSKAELGSLAMAASTRSPAGGPILGRAIPQFSAAGIDNTTFHSADQHEKILVVAFMGVECPLANLYGPRLVELEHRFHDQSVGFVAINSNAQDTLDAVRDQARSLRITFPVLKDAGNAVADLFGAGRTPEVFVLDEKRTVRYHGAIDDQYGYRHRRSQPIKRYLSDALAAVLSGKDVAQAETPMEGCHIGRTAKASAQATTSFYRDVLPVLQNRCQQCHRKGEIAPFALTDYETIRNWAPTIREAVTDHRMPPWPADPNIGKFANDISLSQGEIDTITKWVDDGCPEGNVSEKPPEKKFVEGWNIGKPDRVFTMPTRYSVRARGVIEYQHFIVSPVFTQDTWVQAVECRFGNRAVVHHMLVLLDFPKDPKKSQDGLTNGFFAAGAPGNTYFVFPKGYAKKIPKGSRLRFQMHYTPNGTAGYDQSRFGIVLAKGSGLKELKTLALGNAKLLIRAGEPDHREWASQPVDIDVLLTTLMPHMHVRGKSFTFSAELADGRKETLLSVPKWDFNWQFAYELSKPLLLKRGSKLVVEAHWDNSTGNPNNILPPVDVQFGEQTWDEMFIGYVNYVLPRKTGRGHSG